MSGDSAGGRMRPRAEVFLWAALGVVLAGAMVLGIRALRQPRGGGERLPILGTVPPFTLVERSGRAVSRETLRGRVWVADFIYTRCPDVCPLLSARMAELQSRARKAGLPVTLVSISVDPGHDTPAVLRRYAERYGADAEHWLFLTGDPEAIYRLARDGFHLSVAARSPGPGRGPGDLITHSDRLVLVDGRGRIRGYYRGADALERLLPDLRRLLREEGSGPAQAGR